MPPFLPTGTCNTDPGSVGVPANQAFLLMTTKGSHAQQLEFVA